MNEESQWVRRAWFLAWFTVVFNLLEGGVSIFFGVCGDSVALWGFGFDSLIEVASAFVVMVRLRKGFKAAGTESERRAVFTIGVLFGLLALVILFGAIQQLVSRHHPPTSLPGLVVSTVSMAFMFYLWRAKTRAAAALDSASLKSDAACSLACIRLSMVLFAGSLLFALRPSLWWMDGAAAALLSLLILKEGMEGIRAARSSDFTGGCGCGHD